MSISQINNNDPFNDTSGSTFGLSNARIDRIENLLQDLAKQNSKLSAELDILKNIVIGHESMLKENKVIKNTYIDTVMSKIEILKNIINENMDNEDLISQHLLMVETIEKQIKQSGKISTKQFDELNTIYKAQKNMQ